jgi:DNA-binding NarL/FixJ family response regulator
MQEKKYIDARTAEQLVLERFEEETDPLSQLTQRQYEILMQIIDGKTPDEISKSLFLSPKTVRNNKAQIMARLGVSNTFELARFALRSGLVKGK